MKNDNLEKKIKISLSQICFATLHILSKFPIFLSFIAYAIFISPERRGSVGQTSQDKVRLIVFWPKP